MQMRQEQQPTYMQALGLRLRSLLLDYDFEPTELISGLAAVLWGALVALPWVNTFATSPSYKAMAEIAPEWVWGVGVLAMGIAQLAVLFADRRFWRQRIATLALLIWLFVEATFVISNPYATGSVIYFVFAFSSAWADWRLSLLLRGAEPDWLRRMQQRIWNWTERQFRRVWRWTFALAQ